MELGWFSYVFSAIGALNWGFVAFFKFDLVKKINSMVGIKGLDRLLYGLIALAGLVSLLMLFMPSAMHNMMY